MDTSKITLNLINESNDQNNSEVVVFQKNVATDFDEIAVAWKVIQKCGKGWHHQFYFPMDMYLSAQDSFGNSLVTPQKAENGELFHVYSGGSGDQMDYFGPAPSRKDVQLRNDLSIGSINANIYKDGKLLATKTGISPSQKATFQFKPTIWIGVVSQIEEGQIMNSAILSDVNTEIGLLGISSADIIMTGGGVGPNATKFNFTLDNVQYV